MEKGTLLEWYKKEGDIVTSGERLFLVETEKTTMEVDATVTGKIIKIIHPDGTALNAGQVVALISVAGEEITDSQLDDVMKRIKVRESGRVVLEKQLSTIEQKQSRREENELSVRASPAARRLMREHAINPSTVIDTGSGGIIRAEDVLRLVQTDSDFKVGSIVELSGRRLTIAEKLGESQVVPVTLMNDVDATSLEESRSRISIEGTKPSLTAIFIVIVSRALRLHSNLNAVFEENKIKMIENINIGIAVDTPEGLIVPVIRNADKLSLPDIVERLATLEKSAHDSSLSYDQVAMGTFTITNLGMLDVQGFTPLVNPPQVAILGVGRMVDKPVVKDGAVAIRKTIVLSLTFDHRAMDGATAAKFLSSLKRMIEEKEVK